MAQPTTDNPPDYESFLYVEDEPTLDELVDQIEARRAAKAEEATRLFALSTNHRGNALSAPALWGVFLCISLMGYAGARLVGTLVTTLHHLIS